MITDVIDKMLVSLIKREMHEFKREVEPTWLKILQMVGNMSKLVANTFLLVENYSCWLNRNPTFNFLYIHYFSQAKLSLSLSILD